MTKSKKVILFTAVMILLVLAFFVKSVDHIPTMTNLLGGSDVVSGKVANDGTGSEAAVGTETSGRDLDPAVGRSGTAQTFRDDKSGVYLGSNKSAQDILSGKAALQNGHEPMESPELERSRLARSESAPIKEIDPEVLLNRTLSEDVHDAPARENGAIELDGGALAKNEVPRDTESRVFAFLNSSSGDPIKVDLFFDKAPSAVNGFVRDILKCSKSTQSRNCQRRVVGLDADIDAEIRATSAAVPTRGIASVISSSGFHGFICAYVPAKGGAAEYTIALNTKDDVPDHCQIIGGIIDSGSLVERIQTELSSNVKYQFAETRFASEMRDGSPEATMHFEKVTALLPKESRD